MMDTDISVVNESRASLYWWFATLLTKELDKQQLALYFSGQGLQLLDQLSEEATFDASVKQIKSALVTVLAIKQPELELAADFSELFLTDAKKGAPPYASVYLSKTGQMFEQPHQDMIAIFKKQGLAVDPNFNEPADHIAIQLDYLGNLIMQDGDNVSDKQITFIEESLLSWLGLFVAATTKVNNTGFYQGVCQLLLEFITQDLAEIKA
ncbi:MAG: molecular chaperone TorD [Psychromonas sp.]